MTWRLAASLDTLRKQIDAARPARRKDWDGTIGDAKHAGRASDHNPNAAGVVTAIDITHDPAGGVDSYALAEWLRQRRDPRIKYVISNGRIFSSTVSPWTWRSYTGSSKHDHHVHVSVSASPELYDAAKPWDLPFQAGPRATRSTSAGRQIGITATVFGGAGDEQPSAYGGQVDPSRPGVALPFRFPAGERPKVRVFRGGRSVVCDVVDVGPWFPSWRGAADPYWTAGSRPRAELDIRTNRAGIDLTPAAAAAIGLPGKGNVDWEFVTSATSPAPSLSGTASAGAVVLGSALAGLPPPLLAGAAIAALVLIAAELRHIPGVRTMLKTILTNWKTTSAGSVGLLGAVIDILVQINTGAFDLGRLMTDATVIATALGLIVAKDSNVTGGTKAQ